MSSHPSFFQDGQHLASLPPELVLEIVSCTVQPPSGTTKSGLAENYASFSSRIKTLTNLSLTTPSLRALILSSPTFWSEVEINIVKDVACSPPLSFLKQLFERSGNVEMSVRVVHWGEEYDDFNQEKRLEWAPGITREIRGLLERNERRIEKLRFDFHHLNGTEYLGRGEIKGGWKSLRHLEMYASDWPTVHSLPMGWVESILATASPETIAVRGSGAFAWPVLGRDMCRLRKLRIETEVPESLALDIVSRTPSLEDCTFSRIVQSRAGVLSRARISSGIMLMILRKLHVGSKRGVGSFLDMLATPRLQELEIDFVETKSTMWNQDAFQRFIYRSQLDCGLKKLVVRRDVMARERLEECKAIFYPRIVVELL